MGADKIDGARRGLQRPVVRVQLDRGSLGMLPSTVPTCGFASDGIAARRAFGKILSDRATRVSGLTASMPIAVPSSSLSQERLMTSLAIDRQNIRHETMEERRCDSAC
jgi:hypothetical protein